MPSPFRGGAPTSTPCEETHPPHWGNVSPCVSPSFPKRVVNVSLGITTSQERQKHGEGGERISVEHCSNPGKTVWNSVPSAQENLKCECIHSPCQEAITQKSWVEVARGQNRNPHPPPKKTKKSLFLTWLHMPRLSLLITKYKGPNARHDSLSSRNLYIK